MSLAPGPLLRTKNWLPAEVQCFPPPRGGGDSFRFNTQGISGKTCCSVSAPVAVYTRLLALVTCSRIRSEGQRTFLAHAGHLTTNVCDASDPKDETTVCPLILIGPSNNPHNLSLLAARLGPFVSGAE
uniref:Uncharacterized protein n=1 Tax=Knipowitschia caucasica TaxID=637954 RepID=A0AAV2LKE9_KNICA